MVLSILVLYMLRDSPLAAVALPQTTSMISSCAEA